MNSTRMVAVGAILGLVAAVPSASWAMQGKPGLWEITEKTDMGGTPAAAPDLSRLPPEARARIQAMNLEMKEQGLTFKRCMTKEQLSTNNPIATRDQRCKTMNVKTWGNSYSADLVCSGKMDAKGHIQVTFDSPEHYSGSETITGTMNGRPIKTEVRFSARWISPNCGNVR